MSVLTQNSIRVFLSSSMARKEGQLGASRFTLGTKVSKQVGLATGVGIGASIELAEESLTLYFQNFLPNILMQCVV